MLRYLAKSSPEDPKYNSVSHPVTSFIISYILERQALILAAGLTHLINIPVPLHFVQEGATTRQVLGLLIFAYWSLLIGSRFVLYGNHQLYDLHWACNLVMVFAAEGLLTNRPYFLGFSLCAITVDQSLFWIDAVGYLFTGYFITGAAKYLTWPETTFMKKITSSHHIWFMPICCFCLEKWSAGCSYIYWGPGVLLFISSITFCSRFFIPYEIKIPSTKVNETNNENLGTAPEERKEENVAKEVQAAEEDKMELIYMNVNLTWEVWKGMTLWSFTKAYVGVYFKI
eukprot:GHVP01047521.1.p1 GENE.GHVP01047521.1~~GHVP01047521.1.p1  ORF type:complete len:285 (-),score=28.14 GHVP01047521.1:75-929(-)